MLKGIPSILSPELLKVLCEASHSDTIVIATGETVIYANIMLQKGVVVE